MSTRTTSSRGLARPHKMEPPKPASGSTLANARTINTERSGKGMRSTGGVAKSYFGNSRAIDTDHHRKD